MTIQKQEGGAGAKLQKKKWGHRKRGKKRTKKVFGKNPIGGTGVFPIGNKSQKVEGGRA